MGMITDNGYFSREIVSLIQCCTYATNCVLTFEVIPLKCLSQDEHWLYEQLKQLNNRLNLSKSL